MPPYAIWTWRLTHKREKRVFEKGKHEEEEAVEIRFGQPVQQNRALWVFSLSCTKNAT